MVHRTIRIKRLLATATFIGVTAVAGSATVRTAAGAASAEVRMNVKNPYPAPELRNVGNWVNSEPLTISSLRGHVVIVAFWTFECINCQRTLPFSNALYAKYHAKGLEIVGVHTPEFDAERKIENVRKAVKSEHIEYPVVQDNSFATFEAYNNRFWPAFYVIDKQGRVRDQYFGEGAYTKRDKIVAALLAE